MISALARRGKLNALRACVRAGYPVSARRAWAAATKGGHPHVVHWLEDHARRDHARRQMLRAVFLRLDSASLGRAAIVCRRWHALAKTCEGYGGTR